MAPLRNPRVLIVALAFTLPLVFAAFTRHAWEDYFITLRSSVNLVEGHGLVFTPGERVHTFTSPLGVLVPALCTAIVGVHHEEAALWLFRLINATALAAGVAMLWRRMDTLRLGSVGRLVLFGLLLTDAKLTDFSINGMETAMLVFFLLLLWCELEAPTGPRTKVIALATAGLMWTRPDAFILGGCIFAAHVVFRGDRQETSWGTLGRGLIIGALLYLPWTAFTWWYYGSPIPNTVLAKGVFMQRPPITELIKVPWYLLKGGTSFRDLFLPPYWAAGGWPSFFRVLGPGAAAIAAFAWLWPRLHPAGRRASFAVFVGMFYLCSIILFPWYIPPWTVLAIIAIAFIADYLAGVTQRSQVLASTWRIFCVVLIAGQVTVLAAVAWQMRLHQRLVETGVRHEIGQWLHDHSQRSDTLFLEPLGYIGYYSGLKTYDFPGLSSPEAVAALKRGKNANYYTNIIEALHPTWVVLRPAETQRDEFQHDSVLVRDYLLVKTWSALPQLNALKFMPGRGWSEWESSYILLHRKPEPTSTTARVDP